MAQEEPSHASCIRPLDPFLFLTLGGACYLFYLQTFSFSTYSIRVEEEC
jgi:hypothetical protein